MEHDPTVCHVNGVVVEKYLWQDATTLLAVLDATDAVLQRFEYADSRMPVSMTAGGQVYYFAHDQVGSLRAVFDNTGALVKRIDYDSFGNILSDSNPALSIPFGFAGGLHDRDTGLVRFGARDYDPATGKWTAKDPVDFGGGDLNLYGYCVYDPVNLVDTTGFVPEDVGNEEVSFTMEELANFSAGFGDIVSLGLTTKFNEMTGADAFVDPCSGDYFAGKVAGVMHAIGSGIAGGVKAAGTAGKGIEFSHWIPKRMGGPRSIWNGNYVPTAVHALSDPFRYRFMPRAWKMLNPMPSRLSQQWVRIPNTIKGTVAGITYVVSSWNIK